MKALVTGAAGFVGSHLTDELLRRGHDVLGIDDFTEYYDPDLKRRNIACALQQPGFRLIEGDVASLDLTSVLERIDVVFHLGAQPGVGASWGDDFRLYLERNVWATQRLLEAARAKGISKLVYASSSSVYGDAVRYPSREDDSPMPISPYGVTKLAGERLCLAYAKGYGVPVVVLRYFTVYGPRQRPDMAFQRFLCALRDGREIPVYGDGRQTRDFTYVADTVQATLRASGIDESGDIINVGGGTHVALLDAIHVLAELIGVPARIQFLPRKPGDVRDTVADTTKMRRLLEYVPRVALRDGLRHQVASTRISEPAHE